MATAGNITAVLTLNASNFQTGLSTALTELEKFTERVNKFNMNASKMTTSIELLFNQLSEVNNRLKLFNQEITKLSKFERLSTAINKMANGLKILSSETIDVEQGINTMNNVFKAWGDTLNGTEIKVKGMVVAERELATATKTSLEEQQQGIAKLNANRDAVQRLITGENQLANAERQVANASNQEASALQKDATSKDKASASSNRLSNSNKTLANSFSMLKSGITLVGSMLAYNFVHNLAMATTETINAKSEMNGYFQMLGYGKSQVDDFNQALEETIQKFPRLNKYALGETISSIGVEFELSAQEMKKAMPVVSMITSEYLRAGRNTSEASLAVKDILQGEFQRLSRETGVKGEQLKEAGWSGDKTDVMGLLEALEKVGKERNWDEFVAKANSLNDAVLIMQNRFSEWSADMVSAVQPTIVGVFNAIMDVAGMFAQKMSGIWQWLASDSWTASAVKIGALVTAIVGLGGAFVKLRTGATLVQTSQMGLLRTITATVLGLKGEEVATLGVRGAIAQKITGLEAEKIAEIGGSQAIYGKVLGLEAEEVAEKGLVGAINSSIIARTKETVETEVQTGANIGFLGSLTAVITGEEIATGTTLTFSEALGVLTAEMLMNPITWFVGALMALAGAFYVATGGLSEHWELMKQFNETIDNSDDIVQQNAEHLKHLGETLGEDSEIYKTTADSIEGFNKKLGSAKALVKAFDDEVKNLGVDLGAIALKNAKDLGISDEGYKELKEYIPSLREGVDTYYHAWQVLHKQKEDYDKSDEELTKRMQSRGAEEKDILDKSEQHLEHYQNFIKHSAEHNTSEDWWGGTWAGMLAGIDSFQLWLDYATEDMAKWWHDFDKTWADLPKQFGEAWNNLKLPDVGKMWNDWVGDAQQSLSDSWQSIVDAFDGNIKEPLLEWWEGFSSFDWLPTFDFDFIGWLTSLFMPDAVSASDGSSDHPSFLEDLKEGFGIDIQAFIDGLTTDPLGFLGLSGGSFDIGAFLSSLIIPNVEGITTWVNTNIIQPFTTGISTGIASIPIIGDILSMLGLIPSTQPDAQSKGSGVGNSIGTGITNMIRSIPIVGDILSILGLIPSTNSDAHSKGYGVGENIKKGEKEGHTGLADNIRAEMDNVISILSKKAGEAYSVAHNIGNQILNGIKNALDMHSPSIISRELIANEFGVYIPQAISDGGDMAYTTAQQYGQQIYDGINSVQSVLGFGDMVEGYESDAQIIATTSETMGLNTTTAFNSMTLAVTDTTNSMQGNVVSSYTTMQQKQNSLLNNMKQSNTTAYNEMYTKSNQSLLQMRTSTENITQQMTKAWIHMKDQIVATANKLKTDSTAHFNKLSETIGSFYRKIQNPSNWGSAGSPEVSSGRRNVRAGRSFASAIRGRGYAGGITSRNSTTPSSTMTISQLKKLICPNGECDNIFDGYNSTDRVNVQDFLSSVGGEHGFGWNDWSGTHYNYIKNKSDQWSMKSPVIQLMGGIPTDASFKVGEFNNGTPRISFSEFQSMAGSIFSAIPYRLYFDSSWKGSWLGALQSGACNCYDGASALIAFANTCGFDGYMAHGSWNGIGHVWAVINGVPMDTTAWQGGYGWTSPKVHGYGSPDVMRAHHTGNFSTDNNKTVNITVDMSNSVVYGVDDLDERIKGATREAMREEFNDPYGVAL